MLRAPQPALPLQGLLAGTTLLLLALCGAFPLSLLVWQSFGGTDELTLRSYGALLSSQSDVEALWNTILLSGLVMVVSALAGAALAWLLTCTDLPGKALWRALLVTGYLEFFPPLIGTIAWIHALNPRIGYLNGLLQPILGLNTGPFDVFSLGGMVWVTALYCYPLVSLAVEGALRRRDPTLEEEARLAGASAWQTASRVILPTILPVMLTSGLLSFSWAAASFGIAIFIGSPAGFHVLSTRILSALQTGGSDAFDETMALSGMLMGIGLIVGGIGSWLARRATQATPWVAPNHVQLVSLHRWQIPVLTLLTLVATFTIALPVASLLLASFSSVAGLGLSPENLTLEHYRYLLSQHHLTIPGLQNSVLLGAASATVVIALGTMLAYLRRPGRAGRNGLGAVTGFLIWLPSATPPTVYALALVLAFSGRYGINLYGTFAMLLVAYAMKDLAGGMRSASTTLGKIDRSLDDELRLAGAARWWAVRHLQVPLLRPGLIAGWLLVFIPAFREISMSIILYGPFTATAGVVLYELQNGGYYQSAAALSVLMLVVVGTATLAAKRVINHATRG